MRTEDFPSFVETDGFSFVCIIWDAVATDEVQGLCLSSETLQLYCIESLHPLRLHMVDSVLRVAVLEVLCRSFIG